MHAGASPSFAATPNGVSHGIKMTRNLESDKNRLKNMINVLQMPHEQMQRQAET